MIKTGLEAMVGAVEKVMNVGNDGIAKGEERKGLGGGEEGRYIKEKLRKDRTENEWHKRERKEE